MKLSWPKIIIIVAALGCVFFWKLFTQQYDQGMKHQAVTVAVSLTPLSAPFYVAQAIDAFDKSCIDITFIDVNGGTRANELVVAGDADFGTASDSVIAFSSLADIELVTHGMFVQSDNDVKLISHNAAKVGDIADLNNKRIGVTLNSAGEYFLMALLAFEGLTFDNISLVDLPPEKLPQALKNQSVDAIVAWEPFAYQTIQSLAHDVTLHQTKNLNSLSFNLITKKQRPNSAATQCLLAGLIDATEFIASHPKRAQSIVKHKLNVEQAFIDWVWQDYIFKVGLDNSLLLSIESQAVWAAKLHHQTSDLHNDHTLLNQYKRFIDSEALMQINPSLVNVHL